MGWDFFDKNGQKRAQVYGAPTAGIVFRKTTAKTINTSVAETDLLNGEFTLGANVLGTTGKLRLVLTGDSLNNNANSSSGPRFKVYYGASALLDTGVPGNNTNWMQSATRFPWRIEVEIAALNATNSQRVTMKGMFQSALGGNVWITQAFTTGAGYTYGLEGNAGGSSGALWLDGAATSSVDDTAAQAVQVTVILPASSANLEIKLLEAIAEIL